MLFRLLLAAAVIAVLYYFMGRYKRLAPEERKKWLLQAALIGTCVLLLLGAVTGRMHWIGAVIAALLGFARFGLRLFGGLSPFLGLLGKGAGLANPIFSTPHLRVTLNLEKKQLSGEVIAGPYTGKNLADLTDTQLLELEKLYETDDKRSYYLIRLVRQQSTAHGFNHAHQNQNYAEVGNPSYNEALQILGLEAYVDQTPPDRALVIKAHKRLMQKLHPDRGGNDYLASRVNQAKDTVLARLNRP
ncbi:DnaJ domain protein [Teredinibacter turnerae T7901]|uniref:DnaJ domain protein n=1 Tax=Teredinibacter turnerae (strain ATCC 39867 / T7901) TaxID=377629 RepID=C5BTH1_TERTT|nr:molecular chaperone DnaJ [Teredinibacter turnerae]ACR12929.1 DnaJ domain protein [Teredinibacter turnerae T7901]